MPAHGKRVVIPVLYDGVDLDDVAARLDLSRTEVIELHCQVDYDVFAIGFLPGFPYAGYLPPALAGLARRSSPRLQVPAGSVAIAGRQTAIYPDGVARRLASAGDNAALHRRSRIRLLPDPGRRSNPVRADIRL